MFSYCYLDKIPVFLFILMEGSERHSGGKRKIYSGQERVDFGNLISFIPLGVEDQCLAENIGPNLCSNKEQT